MSLSKNSFLKNNFASTASVDYQKYYYSLYKVIKQK